MKTYPRILCLSCLLFAACRHDKGATPEPLCDQETSRLTKLSEYRLDVGAMYSEVTSYFSSATGQCEGWLDSTTNERCSISRLANGTVVVSGPANGGRTYKYVFDYDANSRLNRVIYYELPDSSLIYSYAYHYNSSNQLQEEIVYRQHVSAGYALTATNMITYSWSGSRLVLRRQFELPSLAIMSSRSYRYHPEMSYLPFTDGIDFSKEAYQIGKPIKGLGASMLQEEITTWPNGTQTKRSIANLAVDNNERITSWTEQLVEPLGAGAFDTSNILYTCQYECR